VLSEVTDIILFFLALLLGLSSTCAAVADDEMATAGLKEMTAPVSSDPSSAQSGHLFLLRDFWNLNNTVPNDYRTMQSPFEDKPGVVAPPTRKGMDELNVSGSGEFTRKSLKLLKRRVPKGFKLMIVDLMQEPHCFVNGLCIAWYCGRNQVNWGKTDEQIRQDEEARLHSLIQEGEATTLGYVKPRSAEGLENGDTPIKIKTRTALSEEQLCHSIGVDYVRIPIPDDISPPKEEIDRFVNLVEQLPKNTWLHIHCAAGNGRTTTFMAFVDMMHNAHDVSFDDIINRQWMIGGFHLMNGKPSAAWKIPYVIERRKVIRDFYDTWQHKTPLPGNGGVSPAS